MNKTAYGALALSLLLASPATAQTGPDWSKVEVKVTDLGHRTYMLLDGISGNVTLAVGDDGIIMVDGMLPPMHDKLKAAIAQLSPQPIKFLINTHHHGDHTGGNAAFAKDGVTTVAHVNVRTMLAAGTTSNTSGNKNPPAAPEALPSRTYENGSVTLEVKGRSAKLTHPENAHTGGDTYVYFADANVLATGDTVVNGRYPNSDWLNGGNLRGMVKVADVYLAMVNDDTKIVPGHGPLASKAQLKTFRDMLEESLKRMDKLIADGKVRSEADAIEAAPFADLDAQWARNEQSARNWIRVVYHSAVAK
jgi:glyoxylase-like metal-dependent hydrolase (beta-lactamase superfamily II)